MIQNKTFDGSGLKKYYWYLYVEVRYWIWKLFGKGEIFMERCTIKNFKFKKWERIFWLARYCYAGFFLPRKTKKDSRWVYY